MIGKKLTRLDLLVFENMLKRHYLSKKSLKAM